MWIGARSRVVPMRRDRSFIYSRFVLAAGFFTQSVQRCAEVGQKVGEWAGQCRRARDQNIVVAGYSIKRKLGLRGDAQAPFSPVPVDSAPDALFCGSEPHPNKAGF